MARPRPNTAARYADHSALGPGGGQDVYSVSRLNNEARDILEGAFPMLWIEAELSNVARPRSGHLYFTLKDDAAQVRCAMFRMHNRGLDFEPENGAQVLVRARVSLYRERGEFQLIAEYMELAGAGALRRAFEQLRNRLAAQGLFDSASKPALPRFPARIGIVTSPSGAALRDVLHVLARRFPAAEVVVYPTRVQGKGAELEIAQALGSAGRRAECDVLLLVRGGGSLEDLWGFNEEVTARAIFACSIPVVSGVGHETDFTIADFVAAARAPTPSAAAEMVTPDSEDIRQRLDRLEIRVVNRARQRLLDAARALSLTVKRLRHPRARLARLAERADELLARLRQANAAQFPRHRQRLAELNTRFARVSPLGRNRDHRARLRELSLRLGSEEERRRTAARARLGELERALHAVSPQRTLDRGYAVIFHAATDGSEAILRAASAVGPGTAIRARLARGQIEGTVTATGPDEREASA